MYLNDIVNNSCLHFNLKSVFVIAVYFGKMKSEMS